MREKVKSWVGSISPLLALIGFVKTFTFQNKTNLIKWRHLSFCLLPLLLKFLRGVLYLCQAHLKKLSLCLDLYFCIFTKPIFKIFVISKVVVVQNRCYRVPTQLRWPREASFRGCGLAEPAYQQWAKGRVVIFFPSPKKCDTCSHFHAVSFIGNGDDVVSHFFKRMYCIRFF